MDSPASNFNVSIPDVASNVRRSLAHQVAASGFVKSIYEALPFHQVVFTEFEVLFTKYPLEFPILCLSHSKLIKGCVHNEVLKPIVSMT